MKGMGEKPRNPYHIHHIIMVKMSEILLALLKTNKQKNYNPCIFTAISLPYKND